MLKKQRKSWNKKNLMLLDKDKTADYENFKFIWNSSNNRFIACTYALTRTNFSLCTYACIWHILWHSLPITTSSKWFSISPDIFGHNQYSVWMVLSDAITKRWARNTHNFAMIHTHVLTHTIEKMGETPSNYLVKQFRLSFYLICRK